MMSKIPLYWMRAGFMAGLLATLVSTGLAQHTASSALPDPSGVIADEFWKSGPTVPEDLPEGPIYPKGKKFLFSFYSVGGGPRNTLLPEEDVQRTFAEYVAAGFKVIGPQYELNARSLADAQRHDFSVVYSVGIPKAEFRDSTDATLPMDVIYKRIYDDVKAVSGDPRIVLWDLRPEELRPWRKREMQLLETAAKAIRDADPMGRPIYHYIAGHYRANNMSAIAKQVDILGKGMYTNYSSQKDNRIWCKWTIEQELEAIALSGTHATPIAIPEMFQQPAPEELGLIPDWVKHDVYLAMVSGAKGILVFSLRQRENFDAWQPYFDAYKVVGQQLLGELGLANVFLFGERRDDLKVEMVDGPETLELSFKSANIEPVQYPTVNIANIAYGNDRYLIAVNSANQSVEVAISGFPYDRVTVHPLLEEGESFNIAEGDFLVTFKPLEVKAWKLTRK